MVVKFFIHEGCLVLHISGIKLQLLRSVRIKLTREKRRFVKLQELIWKGFYHQR